MDDLDPIPSSEITPPEQYQNRRAIMRGAIVVASAATTGLVYRGLNSPSQATVDEPKLDNLTVAAPDAGAGVDEGFRVDEPMTPLASVAHYNNFYEFSTDKDGVADRAAGFQTKGWRVSVEGLVGTPRVFELDDLLRISPPEERVYRMRCVEAWSMVIPWAGFPLSKLLALV
ncbi:MAG TPA: molybdopterin-dependent oxidoreductase, partial [Polyangia bacterium]|nr:molybdopterin-dependent oxidoreductase [Polyangia bacterium]